MIVVRLKGGLGNQMFQYATAYALAKEHNQEVKINMSLAFKMTARKKRLSEFKIEYNEEIVEKDLPVFIKILKNRYINKLCRIINVKNIHIGEYLYFLEAREVYYDDLLGSNYKKLYLDGYFQTEKYFEKYRNEILKQYMPKNNLGIDFEKIKDRIECCNSIAVHVRRGDFKKDRSKFHYLLDDSYYRNAIKYIKERVDNPIFFWFSDDVEWVKDNFNIDDGYVLVDIKSKDADMIDLLLMKSCKHIITANSTYSWWAAWLNEREDAIKVVPDKTYGNKYMIPNEWNKIKVR